MKPPPRVLAPLAFAIALAAASVIRADPASPATAAPPARGLGTEGAPRSPHGEADPALATPAAGLAAIAAAPTPELPTRVPVAGDRPVQVAHGSPGDRRALVYLHGVCGRIEAFRAWEHAAVRHGTVVALLGDKPCEGTGRFSWGPDVAHLDARVAAALRAVGDVRGDPIDLGAVTVVGYSQGSLRAAGLARRFPARYRRVVLAASPTAPSPDGLSPIRAALVAGGLDRRQHLFEASRAFRSAGLDAAYFELPGAHHGEYGPEADRAMGDVLGWLFDGG